MEANNKIIYLECMREIRQRSEVIDNLYDEKRTKLPQEARLEALCGQIRKILELIAFSTVIAYENEYIEIYSDFSKDWNARRLLENLKKVNPDFYPKPVSATRSIEDTNKIEITELSGSYLTKSKFVKIYSKCGKIAHARNPRGATIDYQYFEDRIPEWVRDIKALLSIHIIRIEEGKEFYLFQMNTPPNGDLHIQEFEAFS